jgi:hypothetical protein
MAGRGDRKRARCAGHWRSVRRSCGAADPGAPQGPPLSDRRARSGGYRTRGSPSSSPPFVATPSFGWGDAVNRSAFRVASDSLAGRTDRHFDPSDRSRVSEHYGAPARSTSPDMRAPWPRGIRAIPSGRGRPESPSESRCAHSGTPFGRGAHRADRRFGRLTFGRRDLTANAQRPRRDLTDALLWRALYGWICR